MTDCIFCKIISKEIPTEVVYDCDDVIAFMDVKPVVRGHVLVVPKVHSADLLETDDEVMVHLMHDVKKVGNAVMKAMNATGMVISTNKGKAAGQSVFHLHFHLIPRFDQDGLVGWPHHEVEPQTRQEAAEEIKKHL